MQWCIYSAPVSPKMPRDAFRMLMMYADLAKDDGTAINPSPKTVAAKLGITTSDVIRYAGMLRQSGCLVKVAPAHDGADGSPRTNTMWRIPLDDVDESQAPKSLHRV